MKKEIFKGSAVALITPFKNGNKKINKEKLKELIDYHIENKTDAIVIAGTTGESSTLSPKEHESIIEFSTTYVNGRIPVIAGTGSNCTEEAVKLSKSASKSGVDGLLIVTPYYNKCSQKGLFKHYKLIAKEVPKTPIILYNVPSRTGVNIEPETVIKLAHIDNIVGVKEASGNLYQAKTIIENIKKQKLDNKFSLYSGNDDQISEIMELGGKGVISVLANICPQVTHKICEYSLKGNQKKSKELEKEYLELVKALFIEVNPIPVKEALNLLGKEVGDLRLPLTTLNKEHKKSLKKTLKKYKTKMY